MSLLSSHGYYKLQFICNKWEKSVHSERAERFSAHPKRAERFFRMQKNKNALKAQQNRPKTEERRAFENLLAHFGCAENPKPSVLSKKDGVLQMNCNL
jgi:hypothetical protein